MAKITIIIRNGDGKRLAQKSIPIRGRMKFWLLAAFKTLHYIASAKEMLPYASTAEIIIDGLADDPSLEYYRAWVSRSSPIPVTFRRVV